MWSFLFALAGLLAIKLDYLTGWQQIVSPEDLPARTNPLTLASLFLCLCATVLQKPLRLPSRAERGLWIAIIVVSALFPFSKGIADAVLWHGDWGRMGANTAIASTLVAASQLLGVQYRNLALASILGAACVVAVAVSGYLMQQTHFYGDMALTTLLVLLPLCFANAVRFVRHPSIAQLLRDDPAGRILRQHLQVWGILFVATPVFLGVGLDTITSVYPMVHTVQLLIGCLAILYFSQKQIGLLDRARRAERSLLKDLSKDALTGVATRKAAIDWFLRVSGKTPVGLIIMDIDHFKQVNDVYGHPTGDAVLQEVARVLRENLRLSDLVARWGGEEFLIAVRVPDKDALYRISEGLRCAVARVQVRPSAPETVTASFGVMLFDPRSNLELGDSVAIADAALYRAKTLGRNRVILAGDEGRAPIGTEERLLAVC